MFTLIKMKKIALVLLAPVIFGVTSGVMASNSVSGEAMKKNDLAGVPFKLKPFIKPDGKGHFIINKKKANSKSSAGGSVATNGIEFNGGPVMTANTTNLYLIFYGNWAADSQALVTTFAKNIGGTRAFNVNTTYTDARGARVKNSLRVVNAINDNYSQGSELDTDQNAWDIVNMAVNNGTLPADANGIYYVLASPDVLQYQRNGFGTSWCGYHGWTIPSSTNHRLRVAVMEDASSQYPTECGLQDISPNGNPGVDQMLSVFFHETSETVTDPELDAWYDSKGNGDENGDKCNTTFGTTYTTSNGAQANQYFGGTDWRIQQMWLNAGGGYCTGSY